MSEIEFISFLKSPSPYPVIWDFQKQRVAEVVAGSSREAVIFCEHEKLVTAGRRTKFENILDRSFPIYEIERGGDVTLHGPGQLVVYPILKLNGGRFPGGLHAYLRFMEQIVIDLLSEMNLVAGRFGPTGVWIKNRQGVTKKIASLGIAVRHWVTYHGLSLNICNDLSDFSKIRPCDFEASIMTSVEQEGIQISVSEMKSRFQTKLAFALQKDFSRSEIGAVENYG